MVSIFRAMLSAVAREEPHYTLVLSNVRPSLTSAGLAVAEFVSLSHYLGIRMLASTPAY